MVGYRFPTPSVFAPTNQFDCDLRSQENEGELIAAFAPGPDSGGGGVDAVSESGMPIDAGDSVERDVLCSTDAPFCSGSIVHSTKSRSFVKNIFVHGSNLTALGRQCLDAGLSAVMVVWVDMEPMILWIGSGCRVFQLADFWCSCGVWREVFSSTRGDVRRIALHPSTELRIVVPGFKADASRTAATSCSAEGMLRRIIRKVRWVCLAFYLLFFYAIVAAYESDRHSLFWDCLFV